MYRYISSRTFGFGHMWTDGSHDIFEPYMTTQELLYKLNEVKGILRQMQPTNGQNNTQE